MIAAIALILLQQDDIRASYIDGIQSPKTM